MDNFKLEESPGMAENTLVDCPGCGEYVITDRAQLFMFFPKDGKAILDEADKKKLADYVRNNRNRGKPVVLSMDVIKVVTGKESVSTRYS
ncbi:hypothetical protein IMZ48_31245 [Candidatus Bathyarchaeota archaeon]|nr:hypothetical protein [Candidatus Bathyarchaeota archaeon]